MCLPLDVYAVSINELHRELHDARAAGGGNGTKGARVAAGIRIAIVRGVEQVEGLRTELQIHPLRKGEILEKREVVVGVARTANEISARIARNWPVVALPRRVSEGPGVEPFLDRALVTRKSGVLAGHQVWPQPWIVGISRVRDNVNRFACVK